MVPVTGSSGPLFRGLSPEVRVRNSRATGNALRGDVAGETRGTAGAVIIAAEKVPLGAVAYLSGTDGSNPPPSSGEADELVYLVHQTCCRSADRARGSV